MKLVSNQKAPPETAAPGAPDSPPPLADLPALTRLKNLPLEDREFLLDLKRTHTCPQMIALVRQRHGIDGLTQPAWSKFHSWMREQHDLRAANDSLRAELADVNERLARLEALLLRRQQQH